jgi:hypothetical protein
MHNIINIQYKKEDSTRRRCALRQYCHCIVHHLVKQDSGREDERDIDISSYLDTSLCFVSLTEPDLHSGGRYLH